MRAEDGLKNIQAIVVPGLGVAAAQANVDSSRKNQQLIYDELKKGTPPSDIIALLQADPSIASRQFGIVDLRGRVSGFSGSGNQAVSIDRQGQVPGTGIFYSIQGNIYTIRPRRSVTALGIINTRTFLVLANIYGASCHFFYYPNGGTHWRKWSAAEFASSGVTG